MTILFFITSLLSGKRLMSVTKAINDKLVWDSFRNGSYDALEIIYEGNYSSLLHYGIKFCSDEYLVKDLIHELFIELIDSGFKLSQTDNIRFYLLKALRNKILKQLTINAKTLNDLSQYKKFSLLESIENQLIKKEVETEIQSLILSSIERLSMRQQEIIYLRFYNDMSYQEIADLFEVNIQSVRNLMTRAIGSLKKDLVKNRINNQIIFFVLSLSV